MEAVIQLTVAERDPGAATHRCVSLGRQGSPLDRTAATRHAAGGRLPGGARRKVDRDCSRRGYTTDRVLEELDRREPDSAGFIRPQQRFADIVVSFMPGDRSDPGHLDAQLTQRDGLAPPSSRPASTARARACAWSRETTSASWSSRVTSIPRTPRRSRRRLGPDALRQPPALRATRRVHDRHPAAPLRVARAGSAARPLPPRHGARRLAWAASGPATVLA